MLLLCTSTDYFFDLTEDDNFYAGGSSHHWIQYYTQSEGDEDLGDGTEPILSKRYVPALMRNISI